MPAPPTPAPRRNRVRRRLAQVGLALGGIALVVLFAPMLLPGRFVGRLLASRIKSSLGLDATIESASVDLIRGLRIRGLAIAQPAAFGEGSLVRVGRGSARLALSTLLRGRPPRVIHLDGVDVNLTRDAHGAWNLPEFTGRPLASTVAIRGGSVHFQDRGTGAEATLVLARAEIAPSEPSFDCELASADGGELRLRGGVLKNPSAGDALEHVLKVDGRDVDPEPFLSFLAAPGWLRRGDGGPRFTANLRVRIFARLFGERSIHGEGQLDFKVTSGQLSGDARPTQWASGEAGFVADVSPARQHLAFHAAAEGCARVRLSGQLDDFITNPKLAAKLSWGARLPLEPPDLACWTWLGRNLCNQLSGSAEAKGTLDRLDVTAGFLCRRYSDGESLSGGIEGEVQAALRPLALSAELSFTAATEGKRTLQGRLDLRPSVLAEPRLSPDGLLPPMVVRGVAELDLGFSRLAPGYQYLLGLPAPLPPKGIVQARSTIAFGGDAASAWTDLMSGLVDPAGPAAGGDWRLALAFRSKDLPLSHDTWPLSGTALLHIASAALGGRPERLSFVADSCGLAVTHGATLAEFADNLACLVRSDLRQYRVAGAPLLRALATVTGRPEMAEIDFDTATDRLRILGADDIEDELTLNLDKGAVVASGAGTFDDCLDYRVGIRNPRGIRLIPKELWGYFEAGLPALVIGGTLDAPTARIPLESIAAYKLKESLRKTPWKGK